MHSIPNERALSHWRALSQLPDRAAIDLKARFLREQPVLVGAVLSMADGVVAGPDGRHRLPDEGDPRLAGTLRLIDSGAILAEIFHREAGRPLRELNDQEVLEVVKTNAEIHDRMEAEDAEDAANFFSTASQPELLKGVAIAHFSDEAVRREDLEAETYALRTFIEGLHRACGDAAATSPRDWDAARVVIALSSEGDPLRREALAVCDGFRAELVPVLVADLERQASEPEAAREEDVSLAMHAAFQLGKWREDSAWPAFRKMFSLPDDLCYELLGDLITQDGSVLLAMVGGRRRDELRAMIVDESLDEYCRGACVDALMCLVAWGEMPREELVSHLRGLLATGTSGNRKSQHVLSSVAAAVSDLEAWELMPEVEAAFDRGAIDEGYIDMDCFRDAKAGLLGSQWELFCRNHSPVTDVAAATSWLDKASPRHEPSSAPLPPYEDRQLVSDSFRPYVAPAKVGRNEPCPCGSGSKYKKCCGR